MSEMILSTIGAPCVGKGSILEDVHKKMLEEARVALVSTSKFVKKLMTPEDVEAMKQGGLFPREGPLREMLSDEVDNLFALGAEVVLLDGFPRWDDQFKWMVQNFIQPISVVQIIAPDDFELSKRASLRNRDEYDVGERFLARLQTQRARIAEMEPLFSMYAIPYTTVINDYKERAVLEFIAKVKWPHREKHKGKRNVPR